MLVILDRDGVINEESPAYIKHPNEWIPIPGSDQAISRLNRAGCWVVVASNQSGIGRGLLSIKTLYLIHQRMRTWLKASDGWLDGIYVCPHTPEVNCACRKPKVGLLTAIARDFLIPASETVFIGDSGRDLEAGCAMGYKTLLVKTGNGKQTALNCPYVEKSAMFDDLKGAVDFLLSPKTNFGK